MTKKSPQTKRSAAAARPARGREAAPSASKKVALSAAERALRETGLAWPEVTEHFPWGHRTLKVAGKAFIFIGGDATAWRVSVKLPNTGMMALALPFAAPTGYGMGKSGWVTASFAPDENPPTPLLLDWLRESYQAVAPARLKKALDGDGATGAVKGRKPRPAGGKGPRAPRGQAGAKEPGSGGRKGTGAAAARGAKRRRSPRAIAGSRDSG